MSDFTCFKCGDGNTPLYCLNCANEIAGNKLGRVQGSVDAICRRVTKWQELDFESMGDEETFESAWEMSRDVIKLTMKDPMIKLAENLVRHMPVNSVKQFIDEMYPPNTQVRDADEAGPRNQ